MAGARQSGIHPLYGRCVSAWNDQGFAHTASDPRRMKRTDYFPGLGWMITASTWATALKPAP